MSLLFQADHRDVYFRKILLRLEGLLEVLPLAEGQGELGFFDVEELALAKLRELLLGKCSLTIKEEVGRR